MRRRDFLTTVAATGAAAVVGGSAHAQAPRPPIKRKGRIKQSLFRTVFGQDTPGLTTLDEQCREAARLGAYGFELIPPSDWPTLKKYGLVPTMAPMIFTTIPDGIVHKDKHDAPEKALRAEVDVCVAGGCEKIITFGGQRKGMSYEAGPRRLRAVPEPREGLPRGQEHHALPREHEQQVSGQRARPAGPAVRSRRVGIRALQARQLTTREDAVRHLPRAGHGRECRRDDQGQHPVDRALPHGGRAGPARDRRHAGIELPPRGADDRRPELHRYVAHEYRPSPGRDPIKSIETDMAILDV